MIEASKARELAMKSAHLSDEAQTVLKNIEDVVWKAYTLGRLSADITHIPLLVPGVEEQLSKLGYSVSKITSANVITSQVIAW